MRTRRVTGTAATSPLQASGRGSGTNEIDSEPISSRYSRSEPPAPIRKREPLLATPHGTLTWDMNHSIGRFVRTSVAYASAADIAREAVLIERALEKAGQIRLLVDLRAASPRNDPAFEADIVKLRRKLCGGGQKVAILVCTAMGALQVKRHMREDGFAVEVFTQEAAALAYLAQRATSERVPRSTEAPASGPGLRRVG
jgi:hypothetical protein